MPPNTPTFVVEAGGPGEVYGMDIGEIAGKQHLVVVDYNSCCIFECELPSLHTTAIVKALKDIFCDVGAPDKIISDNATYFKSEEFQNFVMDWSIQHITSSPRFPHSNAHAKKAVGIIKQIYERCQDVKLGLLLLKTTPITNRDQSKNHQAPGNVFFGHTIKAHLPIYQSCTNLIENTCTLGTEDSAIFAQNDVPSKYSEGQDVWLKLDPSTKWMPGKVIQILPFQSYMVKLSDGQIFRRN